MDTYSSAVYFIWTLIHRQCILYGHLFRGSVFYMDTYSSAVYFIWTLIHRQCILYGHLFIGGVFACKTCFVDI